VPVSRHRAEAMGRKRWGGQPILRGGGVEILTEAVGNGRAPMEKRHDATRARLWARHLDSVA
jgi:hypothetical protein